MDKSSSDTIPIYKPLGLTPAQAIDIFRKENPKYKNQAISHAGKLDPLAEGLLLLVTGKLTTPKNLKRYLNLSKEYKAKILFGFSTDSYDIQGIPVKGEKMKIDQTTLLQEIEKLKGEHLQSTPPFSGRKVNGKPLYYYARKNKLNEITIPKQKIIIKKIEASNFSTIGNKQLLEEIIKKINLLEGDFRQEEILTKWKELLKENQEFYTIDILVQCSSGTYIRSIANDLGEKFNKGILLGLVRNKIGEFSISHSMKI